MLATEKKKKCGQRGGQDGEHTGWTSNILKEEGNEKGIHHLVLALV